MPKLTKPRRKIPDNLQNEQLLSIPRIAELEDSSEETIWRDIRAGRLPPLRRKRRTPEAAGATRWRQQIDPFADE
jgi:predicted DNA-binding transcriptional regulator AlpA